MAMNILDRALRQIAPGMALSRVRNRQALDVMAMHYQASEAGSRASSWRVNRSDADGAARSRDRLAAIARDMIRNTPLALRAQQVIASNAVGDGIIPKVMSNSAAVREELLALIEAHFDTTAIDADGRTTLYGLQRLALNTVVDSGEVLIRRRRRLRSDGLPLPFQIQVLEPDYLDRSHDGTSADGRTIREGIEYDAIGRRAAYHLLGDHPGSRRWTGSRRNTRRVDASEILHIYRQDRPGQMRGVSWFAPIALSLQDLADHQDAQLMRQKIAACFTAFRVAPDAEPVDTKDPGGLSTLVPGRIQNLAPGEDIRFSAPPGVQGYGEFTRSVLLSVAAGMGITYEALTGDLSNVNFSSGRMGRMEMDRNITAWQWLMLIPQMMQPIGQWMLDAWRIESPRRAAEARIDWVPPNRMMVDPNRELSALRDKVRSGFASRSSVIRELGYDPERVLAEQRADAFAADLAELIFDTDPRKVSLSGVRQDDNAGGSGQ
jgi:lambda family phage portal protein